SAQAAVMSPAGARQASKAQAGESPEMKQLMAIGVAAAVSAGASAQSAVQWRVEDGGNGHWYAINESFAFWNEARAAALLQGGDLTSLETNEEWTWMRSWLPRILHGYLLGGYQLPRSPSPSDGWKWLTGGDVQRDWMVMDDNPCGASPAGIEDDQQGYLHTCCQETGWGDLDEGGWGCDLRLRSIIEWSADCNADGLVDYGQIRAGQLPDANGNNIPDCCENGGSCCPGDTNNDQSVDGIDLATVLTRWGMPGAKFPQADCNDDGVIDGTDLAIVLAGWGGCV
ncbi:MAG: dockerin type I domain-containing protein, partial [bacterium]